MLFDQIMNTFTRNRVRDRSYSKLPTNCDTRRTKRIKFRRKSVMKIAILFVLITLFYFDFVSSRSGVDFLNNILYRVNYHDVRHVIVIDAGSTGSRVIAFSFYKQLITKEIQLIDEHRMITKPGLSSYANNAENASTSITKLLDQVITNIPKSQWSQTPLILRATAGLRLLDESIANKLLGTIRNRLLSYPFIANKESVEIMKGDDEGIFSWLTVNYLLGTLHTTPENTVAALDLGGGSTQVTLTVTLPEVIQKSPYLYRIKQFANSQVYTRSYLGLGLKAARHEILTRRNETQIVSSMCVNKKYKNIPWTYSNHEHFVNGLLNDLVDFEKCDDFVRNFVMAQVEEIEELPKRKIVAFSYYFDKAFDYKITKSEVGETVFVKQFKTAAKKICLQSEDSDNAFGCVDLVFISNLLQYGFQLNEDTEIHLKKKINGHEISWALGLAIDSVENLF